MLVPAAIGAAWYWDNVVGVAGVHVLCPRIAFYGHHKRDKETKRFECELRAEKKGIPNSCLGCSTYPKDLFLCTYGFGEESEAGAVYRWEWKL